MPIQGFSQGPIIGGSDPEERAANLEKYKQKLDHVCADFVIKSKELSRRAASRGGARSRAWPHGGGALGRAVRRRARAARSLADAERVLDLILRGVESWQRANPRRPTNGPHPPPSPSPAPEDRPLKDAERLLDLLRRGIESWRRDPSCPRNGPPEKRPEPGSGPDQSLLKDAEQLLDLLRRGVESWQGR